jgi:hypothetical protein
MTDQAIPADDPTRDLTLVDVNDEKLTHLAIVGDTYTILTRGADTGGRYALIDMLIPAGGGPPPTATISRRCSTSSTVRYK